MLNFKIVIDIIIIRLHRRSYFVNGEPNYADDPHHHKEQKIIERKKNNIYKD